MNKIEEEIHSLKQEIEKNASRKDAVKRLGLLAIDEYFLREIAGEDENFHFTDQSEFIIQEYCGKLQMAIIELQKQIDEKMRLAKLYKSFDDFYEEEG